MNVSSILPLTPPPSAMQIAYHLSLNSCKDNKKLSLLFSNGTSKTKREWKYLKGFPKLSSCSISKRKLLLSPSISLKSTAAADASPLSIQNGNINDESDCECSSSSSFATYPISSTTQIIHDKNKKINISNHRNVINDSTDYDLSDTDDISSTHNDYPWPTSPDDSFAALSDAQVYKKLKEKLTPLYIYSKVEDDKQTCTDSHENKNENENNNDIDIDPTLYDAKNGRYLSFIIHKTPILSDDSYVDCEYEGDNEDDNDLNQINTLQFMSVPLQSTCTPVDSDMFVCNLTDIDE